VPLIDIALYRQSSPAARIILSVRNGLQTDEFMEMNALRTIVDLVQQDLGVAVVPLARNATGPEDSRLRVTRNASLLEMSLCSCRQRNRRTEVPNGPATG